MPLSLNNHRRKLILVLFLKFSPDKEAVSKHQPEPHDSSLLAWVNYIPGHRGKLLNCYLEPLENHG